MKCKECLHIAVCSKYIATGGTDNCKHFMKQKQAQETPMPKTYTLEEIAWMICNSYDECAEGKCPGFDYCHKGENGVLVWLKLIVSKNEISSATLTALEKMGRKAHGER